jgi:hypothetical protein
MQGLGFWIWYVPSLDDPLAKVKRANATHVLVKGADGSDVWPQLSRSLVDHLHSHNLSVYAWQYCYGDDPEGEAAAARALLELPVDGIVADVEAEYEGKPAQAERYAAIVRDAAGDRLFGYAPLPVIDLHTALPYLQFNRVCDVVLPQLYSRALGASRWPLPLLFSIWERWAATWSAWGAPMPPMAPIGETFGEATAEDVRAFEAAARARGLAARSYWALDHARPEHIEALAALSPEPALTRALDGVWAETERLARLGHEGEAVAIQRHVVDLKSALGIA